MAATALIGHTGFIGGALAPRLNFDRLFNSRNIEEICGESYAEVVCCGLPAAKWQANQNPASDLDNVERLMNCLRKVQVERLILVSTVDVFADVSSNGCESDEPGLAAEPYGRHRREFEQFVEKTFRSHILRLPALFGSGLKKNVLFDLINRHRVGHINPHSTFQWYDIERLADDIGMVLRHQLRLVHLVTEPICTKLIISENFPELWPELAQHETPLPSCYNLRTSYGSLFGGDDNWIEGKMATLDRIRRYVQQVKGI